MSKQQFYKITRFFRLHFMEQSSNYLNRAQGYMVIVMVIYI